MEKPRNVDMLELGITYHEVMGYETGSDGECIQAAKQLLAAVEPFPLTGDGQEDVDRLLEYLVAVFSKHGIVLDVDAMEIDHDNFVNSIEIPASGGNVHRISTDLAYSELLFSWGDEIRISLTIFDENEQQFTVQDIADSEELDGVLTSIAGT